MGQRNFREELDRITTEFERDAAMLEEVWEALRSRGDETIAVSPAELAEIEEACAVSKPKSQPTILGVTRC